MRCKRKHYARAERDYLSIKVQEKQRFDSRSENFCEIMGAEEETSRTT
jgi:hypothetical protein